MKTVIKQYLNKLLIFILFITSPLFSIGPEYIKDTYLPIAIKFRYLSPIHGAMWWEGGVIRKYFEFGPREEKGEHDKDWLAKADGPVRLVYALFNMVQGSFGISTNAAYPAHHLSAKTIAKIVCELEKSAGKIYVYDLETIIRTDPDFVISISETTKKYSAIKAQYGTAITSIKKRLQKEISDTEKNTLDTELKSIEDSQNKELSKQDVSRLFQEQNIISLAATIEKKDADEQTLLKAQQQLESLKKEKNPENEKTIVKLIKKIRVLSKNIKKLSQEIIKKQEGKAGYRRLRELAQAIIDAYNDTTNLYPPYSVYYILTAFMYRKAQTKKEFLDYFDILNKELGIFEKQMSSNFQDKSFRTKFINSKFDSSKLLTIKEKLNQWITIPDMTTLTAKLYEDAVYGQIIENFYKSNFPKAAEYKEIKFETAEPFSDCAETMIRNLCNIILYDKKTNAFDLSKVRTINLKSSFAKFYKSNSSATQLEDQSVYQAWAPVIENQQWVTYSSKLDKHGLTQIAPLHKKGFLVVPSDLSRDLLEKLTKRGFFPIDGSTEKGFEVAPSVRNIIILLNKFFGLNLFTDIKKDFVKPDFNKTFLPQLAKNIEPLPYPRYDEKTIDDDDFSPEKAILLSFYGFSIGIIRSHAVLRIKYARQNITDLTPILIAHLINDYNPIKNYLLIELLSIFSLSIDEFMKIGEQGRFPLIFFTNLFDVDVSSKILPKHLIPNMFSKNDVMSKASTLMTLSILKVLIEQTDLKYFIQTMDNLPLPVESVGNFVTNYAEKIIKTNTSRSLNIINILLDNDYKLSFSSAVKCAEYATKSNDRTTQISGLGFFVKLVDTNYQESFEPANQAANLAIDFTDYSVQRYCLELFGKLINKNYQKAFKNAAHVALQTVTNIVSGHIKVAGYKKNKLLNLSFDIFYALFKKEQYDLIFETVTQLKDSPDNNVKQRAQILLQQIEEIQSKKAK